MSKIKELYEQIDKELDVCDKAKTPVVCSNLATENSRSCIRQTIAEVMLSRHINIAQAIVEVEKSFSENNID